MINIFNLHSLSPNNILVPHILCKLLNRHQLGTWECPPPTQDPKSHMLLHSPSKSLSCAHQLPKFYQTLFLPSLGRCSCFLPPKTLESHLDVVFQCLLHQGKLAPTWYPMTIHSIFHAPGVLELGLLIKTHAQLILGWYCTAPISLIQPLNRFSFYHSYIDGMEIMILYCSRIMSI